MTHTEIKEIFAELPEIIDTFPRYIIGFGEGLLENPISFSTGEPKGEIEMLGTDKENVIDRIKDIKDDIYYYIETWSKGGAIKVYLQKNLEDFTPVYTIYDGHKTPDNSPTHRTWCMELNELPSA